MLTASYPFGQSDHLWERVTGNVLTINTLFAQYAITSGSALRKKTTRGYQFSENIDNQDSLSSLAISLMNTKNFYSLESVVWQYIIFLYIFFETSTKCICYLSISVQLIWKYTWLVIVYVQPCDWLHNNLSIGTNVFALCLSFFANQYLDMRRNLMIWKHLLVMLY